MKFSELELKGAYLIEPELINDNRGFFARSFCIDEFQANNLEFEIKQSNLSFNKDKGTLRGMHFQQEPFAEAKLVKCISGSIYDIIVDLRKESQTYKQWLGMELSSINRKMLYIPKGFAHGFQTLEDNVEVFYQMFEKYAPGFSSGVKWNDVSLSIKWPIPISVISEKDKSYPDMD